MKFPDLQYLYTTIMSDLCWQNSSSIPWCPLGSSK